MSRRYAVLGNDGAEYSADARDYWAANDHSRLDGALVRLDHPWRTAGGQVVRAPRLLKSDARVSDLRRICP